MICFRHLVVLLSWFGVVTTTAGEGRSLHSGVSTEEIQPAATCDAEEKERDRAILELALANDKIRELELKLSNLQRHAGADQELPNASTNYRGSRHADWRRGLQAPPKIPPPPPPDPPPPPPKKKGSKKKNIKSAKKKKGPPPKGPPTPAPSGNPTPKVTVCSYSVCFRIV